MNGQGLFRNFLLVAADLVCIAVCWVAALVSYDVFGSGHYEYSFYLRMWPVAVAVVFLNGLFRLYHGRFWRPAAPVPPVEEFRRLFGSAVITHIGTIAVIAIARQTTLDYSRAVMMIAGVLTAFLAQPCRDLVRWLLHAVRLGQIPVHFIGDGESAERRKEVLNGDYHMGFRVVAADRRADIVVASVDPRILRCRMGALLDDYTHIEYLPLDGSYPVAGSHLFTFGGMGGVEFVNQKRMRLLKVEKWLMDKTLALLTFVLVSPLFVIVPILIKLTSRGPVFYRHARLGLQGKPIRIWKFRTMHEDADRRLEAMLASDPALRAEFEATFKLKRDPRITLLGRFLRKTSLDEFPQLLNVFTGDMALVGPRPVVEREVAYYGRSYPVFSSVKPGITGLWQATGRSDTDYAGRVALDVQYVLNWSPWMDIWILVRTAFAVVFMRGAC